MSQSIFLMLAGILGASCCFAQTASIEASLLYESPELYQGKVVSIVGLLELHFEGDTVCKTHELKDLEYCLGIDLSDFDRKDLDILQGAPVRVEGEFQLQDLDYDFQTVDEDGTIHLQFGPYFHKLIKIKNVSKYEGH